MRQTGRFITRVPEKNGSTVSQRWRNYDFVGE
jgi:hypothetical protein